MLRKCCIQYASKFEKFQRSPHDWKRSVLISVTKKGNAKECLSYFRIAHFSHASIVMLKILQVKLQQYLIDELPDVQIDCIKGRWSRDQIYSICWIIEKTREFQKKKSISDLLTMPKSLSVWITTNCGKLLMRCEYQTTWPSSWDFCMQVRNQELELDTEQQTDSK